MRQQHHALITGGAGPPKRNDARRICVPTYQSSSDEFKRLEKPTMEDELRPLPSPLPYSTIDTATYSGSKRDLDTSLFKNSCPPRCHCRDRRIRLVRVNFATRFSGAANRTSGLACALDLERAKLWGVCDGGWNRWDQFYRFFLFSFFHWEDNWQSFVACKLSRNVIMTNEKY